MKTIVVLLLVIFAVACMGVKQCYVCTHFNPAGTNKTVNNECKNADAKYKKTCSDVGVSEELQTLLGIPFDKAPVDDGKPNEYACAVSIRSNSKADETQRGCVRKIDDQSVTGTVGSFNVKSVICNKENCNTDTGSSGSKVVPSAVILSTLFYISKMYH